MIINFKVEKLADLKPGASLVELIYGPGGTGKTYYGGGCDLVISAGEGIETLLDKNYTPDTGFSPNIIFVRETFDPKTGIFKKAEAFDTVTDALDWFLTQDDLKSVCIDDATFLSMFAKNKSIEVMGETGRSKAHETSKNIGFVTLGVQDYGEEIKILSWFLATYVSQFKAKEKDFVLLAHERNIMEHIDPNRPMLGKRVAKTLPGFTGETFPDQIQAFFDHVWHAESIVSNGKFFPKFRTFGDSKTMVLKTRGSLFKETIAPKFPLVKKSVLTQTPYEEVVKEYNSKLGKK